MGNAIMTSERISEIEFIEVFAARIYKELKAAEKKHPKFCDKFIDESRVSWADAEMRIKARNSQPPEYADCVLMEEMAEAFNAYSKGDLEYALHEFAQVGAVAIRCMFFVMDEKLKREKNG